MGRIYQVHTTPILDIEHIKEEDFYDYLSPGSYFDRVFNTYNEGSDFIDFIKNYADLNNNSFIFHKDAKEKYFKSSFEKFKELVSKMSLEDFADDNYQYELSSLIEDRFGDYIQSDEYGLCTFDFFVRNIVQGRTYYLGGIVGYK